MQKSQPGVSLMPNYILRLRISPAFSISLCRSFRRPVLDRIISLHYGSTKFSSRMSLSRSTRCFIFSISSFIDCERSDTSFGGQLDVTAEPRQTFEDAFASCRAAGLDFPGVVLRDVAKRKLIRNALWTQSFTRVSAKSVALPSRNVTYLR